MNRDDAAVKTSYNIRDVLGDFDADEVQTMLEKRCRAGIMSVDASSMSANPMEHFARNVDQQKQHLNVANISMFSGLLRRYR